MDIKDYKNNGNHILVGLGGTGGKILRAFKMRMFEEFPTKADRDLLPVQLLYVDSTDEMMPKDGRPRPDFRVMGQDASFETREFLNIKAVDIAYILDHINSFPAIKGIVKNAQAVKTAIGSLGQAAGQMRRAGRILFAANARAYVNCLRDAYGRCEQISGNANKKYIHIFAGLCGGTGSGSIIDAIVQARKTYPDAIITVYAMIPEQNLPKNNMDKGRYYPNGYAAINELNALQAGRFFPQDVTGTGSINLYNGEIKGVANGITIYSNVNENGLVSNSLEELPKIISDYVFARIFFVDESDLIHFEDILRAYNFENMDQFALEYDEAGIMDTNQQIPVARTKKINSIGIKRVMYPELRILKHITYTVGESVLHQFKYNNWRENQGFINTERNRDYRRDFLNADNLQRWKLDESHLKLEEKILDSDPNYERFNEFWHDKAIGYANEAQKASNPLQELDNIMSEFYKNYFRDGGIQKFFEDKRKAMPDMAREIRSCIEKELFVKWKEGELSIIELQKISKLLLERLADIKTELEARINAEKENYEAYDQEREDNVADYKKYGIISGTVFGKKKDCFAAHQDILTNYYTSKTDLVALPFAKDLASKVLLELTKMDADITAFASKINDAIKETENLIGAQRKVNKGLEDYKSAVIEVSEEELMVEFEKELMVDKGDMSNIAQQLRLKILPEENFIGFRKLEESIDMDDIKDVFDTTLSKIVIEKHDSKLEGSERKVLGLNILKELRQQLSTDTDIREFATKIIRQSGVFLKLNVDQMNMSVPNNENDLDPIINPASINQKTVLVSIPSDERNPNLKHFSDKLESAFRSQFGGGAAQGSVIFNRTVTRPHELSIITIQYCYPMRAIDWLSDYKERYEKFLHTGNEATDLKNSILLHSEGNGEDLPSLFVRSEEEIEKIKNANQMAQQHAQQSMQTIPGSPSMNAGIPPVFPGNMPPQMPQPEPEISVFMYVGGQQYGPYGRALLKQFVERKQLTPQTYVWMEGMPQWTEAGQVPALQSLFAPAVPPMPPMGSNMPPMPPSM